MDPVKNPPEPNMLNESGHKENAGALAPTRRMEGFTTANGKPVYISKTALETARKFFESIDVDVQHLPSPPRPISPDVYRRKKSFEELDDDESSTGPAEKKVKLIETSEEESLEKSMHQQELLESISALLADEETGNGSEGEEWTGLGQDTAGQGSPSS